jgi:hypothetical protein
MNFCQFWNAINGEPYADGTPEPVQYNLKKMMDSPVNDMESGSYELRPLQPEDMMRYGADDVADHYAKLHNGKNPMLLGKEMTDDEFKKFYGHTW